MKIQNQYIEPIIFFLQSLSPLPAKVSRMRVRFINKATEQLKQIQDERMVIIEKFAERDENGELKSEKNENQLLYTFMPENRVEANNELYDLLLEHWIIEENEINQNMLVTLRDYFMDYDGAINNNAEAHAVLCDALEEVKYE